jgi:hypothetical protein
MWRSLEGPEGGGRLCCGAMDMDMICESYRIPGGRNLINGAERVRVEGHLTSVRPIVKLYLMSRTVIIFSDHVVT